MTRKSEKIELFGHEVILAERDAEDMLGWMEAQKESESFPETLGLALIVLEDALKPNLKLIPKRIRFQERKKVLEWNGLFSVNGLKKLSPSEIFEFRDIVLKMEGFDLEKKKDRGNPSPEKSQEPQSVPS